MVDTKVRGQNWVWSNHHTPRQLYALRHVRPPHSLPRPVYLYPHPPDPLFLHDVLVDILVFVKCIICRRFSLNI